MQGILGILEFYLDILSWWLRDNKKRYGPHCGKIQLFVQNSMTLSHWDSDDIRHWDSGTLRLWDTETLKCRTKSFTELPQCVVLIWEIFLECRSDRQFNGIRDSDTTFLVPRAKRTKGHFLMWKYLVIVHAWISFSKLIFFPPSELPKT